ncbi:MAG: CDP-alcohol phosphatidyltransferase family protein [Dinghuibacter sp.]|nr:CDP-alcohol phosphatidyltransferase family protein [Dinghuibacter sp.]
MKQIPNLFTLLNLFFGGIAIIHILQTSSFTYYIDAGGEMRFAGSQSIPESWWYGSLFIGLAAVVDFFDGFLARFLNAASPLGKQLDSLADVVSFGVAPSLIIYQMLRMSYMQQPNAADINEWLLYPALFLACAAAWRLGKFNLDNAQEKYFRGVPTPAVGLLVASFPLILHKNQLGLEGLLLNQWFLYALVAVLCYLMTCNQKMFNLKFSRSELKNQGPLFVLAAVAIAGIFFLKWVTVPVVFFGYVLLSLAFQHKMKP